MVVHENSVPVGEAKTQVGDLAADAWITRLDAPLAGAATGPLAGLRFAVKDNIDVAGVPTTAACPAFARTPAAHAHVVQRLLDAGASGRQDQSRPVRLRPERHALALWRGARILRCALCSGGSSSGSAYVVAPGGLLRAGHRHRRVRAACRLA